MPYRRTILSYVKIGPLLERDDLDLIAELGGAKLVPPVNEVAHLCAQTLEANVTITWVLE
jgi:hypothetical protein